MKIEESVAGLMIDALRSRDDVEAITLFGSRARSKDNACADGGSDVDIQIISSRVDKLIEKSWATAVLAPTAISAWNVRPAFGGVIKISALLSDGEIDMVVVPSSRMRLARWAVALGLHLRSKKIQRKLGDLVLVMGGGYRVLQGGAKWELFWKRIVAEIPEPSLSLAEVLNLGEGVKVELISIRRKLDRGELRAAQRWLHLGIGETNFKLSHELRRRRGVRSFHDGRRVEQLLDPEELSLVTISAALTAESIWEAAQAAAEATTRLIEALSREY
jgi:hypothetical protein